MRPIGLNKIILFNLYIRKKLSSIKISKIYKCSAITILQYLKKYNIKIRLTGIKLNQKISITGNKKCFKCGEIKRISKFYRIGGYCKECCKILNKITRNKNKKHYLKISLQYRRKNKDKINQKAKIYRTLHTKKIRNKYLKLTYGISLKDYNNLLKKQNYKCAICKSPTKKFIKKLDVDHIHNSKLIRGLLCNHCNIMLGWAKENINILKNAILYLRRYQC